MFIKIKDKFHLFYQSSRSVALALILVIMITALTIVSAVVISMVNTSDLMSSYSFSEDEKTSVDLDACLEDALFRLASSTTASGTYYLNGAGVNCYYQISSTASAGFKTVTSTASSTSDIGYWEDTIVAQINVSSSPIRVHSYKNFDMSYAPIGAAAYCGDGLCNGSDTTVNCVADCGSSCGDGTCNGSETTVNCVADCGSSCGDGTCNGSETCSNCSGDCGSCATCGNGAVEGSEVCDDGNTNAEACGDGVKQTGGAIYCNSTCTAVITRNEACDYTGLEASGDPGCYFGDVGCSNPRHNGCRTNCTLCTICAIIIE